jgi:hypothetical protein
MGEQFGQKTAIANDRGLKTSGAFIGMNTFTYMYLLRGLKSTTYTMQNNPIFSQ